ncbi:MAG: PEP/pyruvate-binding domain-containing protein [Deltaproteobacteria bacterium]
MPVLPFTDIEPGDLARVGGKGLNLGLMLRGGLPVPDGFCLTANGASDGGELDRQELLAAYRSLGAGLVAVRSSAAAEDGAEHSFAGQQETILGVEGEQPLLDAVERCFRSWESARSQAYRAQKGLLSNGTGAGMAVVVQRLVPADVSGVLFTRDPLDPQGKQMLVEAAWGLGELIVSGRVSPDRFQIDRETRAVVHEEIGRKHVRMTAVGVRDVAAHEQSLPSLDPDQLRQLAELGLRVEEFYGAPRDIEWAFAEGRLWLLQARPVTAAGAFEKEEFRRAEIARLRSKAANTGTVWARYNLAEVLPRPTPMTWAIVRQFMSGRGGYGQMFRDLGFDPDPELDDEGIIDLVCGRPYVNLSREPKLYFRDFPYGYDFASLKEHPSASFYPQPGVRPELATGRMWLKVPAIVYRMFRAQARMRRQMETLANELHTRVFPEFAAAVAQARKDELARLSPSELHDRLRFWIARTLVDFARVGLRPSMFAAAAMTNLENGLKAIVGGERAALAARELLTGVHPDADVDLAEAMRALVEGKLSRDEFLSRFGHRGPQEMELSQPRWSEDPAALPAGAESPERVSPGRAPARGALVQSEAPAGEEIVSLSTRGEGVVPSPLMGEGQGGGGKPADARPPTPALPHEGGGRRNQGPHIVAPDDRWNRFVADHPGHRTRLERLEPEYRRAREFLALREAAKHHLMQGYALIRSLLLEIDRRHNLSGGVFFLTPDELPRLLSGRSFDAVIVTRRKERQLALSIEAPAVIFSDDLETIGRAAAQADSVVGTDWQGTPVSAGLAEGEALVLTEPPASVPARSGFILVCPSTDPAWVPLFLMSAGVVMETGGILSHGAIVAREFALPAVVGIPDVHRRLQTGQRLRVDGNSGKITVLDGTGAKPAGT